jgi:hypothetical protein
MDMYEVNAKVIKRIICRVGASSYEDAAEIAREQISESESLDTSDEVTISYVVKLDGMEDDG